MNKRYLVSKVFRDHDLSNNLKNIIIEKEYVESKNVEECFLLYDKGKIFHLLTPKFFTEMDNYYERILLDISEDLSVRIRYLIMDIKDTFDYEDGVPKMLSIPNAGTYTEDQRDLEKSIKITREKITSFFSGHSL